VVADFARTAAILRGGYADKVDPERSVAVLSNGLLAIRMGKAGLEMPVPRVA
jgi:hypothetical protein